MLESMEFQKPKVLKRSVQQEEWKLLLGKWKGKYKLVPSLSFFWKVTSYLNSFGKKYLDG